MKRLPCRTTNHIGFTIVQFGLAVLMGSFLAGCTTILPLNYSPSSVLSASGAVTVSEFTYAPAVNGKVQPNQIKNTAMGNLFFDQNINVFFRDAAFKELRFVGVKVDSKHRTLTGEIKDFVIDDLGYSVDWTLRVMYRVQATQGNQTLYESEKLTQRNTAKLVNAFGAMNEVIKLNIDEIIKDPAFIKAINTE